MPLATSDSIEQLKKFLKSGEILIDIMDTFVEKLKLWYTRTNRFYKVIAVLLLVESGLVPGSQYGFYCGDPALSFPYKGDTIAWKWLVVTAIALPFIVMLIVEKKYYANKRECKSRALQWYEEYMYGFLLNVTVIEVIKLMVGSPRPHFFDTCRPKEAERCRGNDFISHYHCTKSAWLRQSDRSFPSGHTSLALHCAFFIAYYLHKRVPCPSILTRAIQSLLLLSAMICAITRYTDRRHHIVDIAAGTVIGATLLAYTIIVLCRNFVIGTDEATQLSTELIESCTNKRKKTKLEKKVTPPETPEEVSEEM